MSREKEEQFVNTRLKGLQVDDIRKNRKGKGFPEESVIVINSGRTKPYGKLMCYLGLARYFD